MGVETKVGTLAFLEDLSVRVKSARLAYISVNQTIILAKLYASYIFHFVKDISFYPIEQIKVIFYQFIKKTQENLIP